MTGVGRKSSPTSGGQQDEQEVRGRHPGLPALAQVEAMSGRFLLALYIRSTMYAFLTVSRTCGQRNSTELVRPLRRQGGEASKPISSLSLPSHHPQRHVQVPDISERLSSRPGACSGDDRVLCRVGQDPRHHAELPERPSSLPGRPDRRRRGFCPPWPRRLPCPSQRAWTDRVGRVRDGVACCCFGRSNDHRGRELCPLPP